MIKTIGLDLDGTLIRSIEYVHNLAARILGIKDYPFPIDFKHSNLTEEHHTKIFELFNDPAFMCNTYIQQPLVDTVEKLREWKLKNYKLIIITAREKPVQDGTFKLVKYYFPNLIDKILFTGMWESKADCMLKEGIDVWIDDADIGVETSIKIGIKTYLIRNEHTFYNNAGALIVPKECQVESIKDIQI